MFDGGRPRPKQMGTAVGDRPHFLKTFLGPVGSTLPFETFAQCDRDRAGYRVAGEVRELAGELRVSSFLMLSPMAVKR